MTPKTLLWPTDLSSHSKKAIGQVVSLAQQHDAKVVVLYSSVDLCAYFPAYGNYPGTDLLNKFREWEMEHAREALKALCRDELQKCPLIEVRLVQGDPAESILKVAREENADLIVMSKYGIGQEARGGTPQDIGNVARRVAQESNIPVQLVDPLT